MIYYHNVRVGLKAHLVSLNYKLRIFNLQKKKNGQLNDFEVYVKKWRNKKYDHMLNIEHCCYI